MTNTPKTRGPYDGSYAHGVTADLDHIKTITEYDRAMDRVGKRRAYLISEYRDIESDYRSISDVSERAKLLKKKNAKESQINVVGKVHKSLLNMKDQIEEKERADQESVEFINFDDE